MTHDAKRSADVRARIALLASTPSDWTAAVERWFSMTETHRCEGAPDDVERYFIFQTLAGAWPIESERISGYMVKALREAKRNTNWVEQNHDWENAVVRFCDALYSDPAFLSDFEPFASRLGVAGDRAALAQLVLKLTVPGVPDIYQGDELPFRALVDPDNRRPVDWSWRRATLARLMGGSAPIPQTYKMFLILRLLGLRGRRPDAFAGGYEPVDADPAACAFIRAGSVFVAVAVRDSWTSGSVQTPRGRWRDLLRGEERSFAAREPLARVLGDYGLAAFERI
jgi:(1->4)-alpha-D-glucan 1-alpha-D-glucosylmutase